MSTTIQCMRILLKILQIRKSLVRKSNKKKTRICHDSPSAAQLSHQYKLCNNGNNKHSFSIFRILRNASKKAKRLHFFNCTFYLSIVTITYKKLYLSSQVNNHAHNDHILFIYLPCSEDAQQL